MGIQENITLHHWNYFIALEDDVVRLSRYIEPTMDNFSTYSLELGRILFSAASEIDDVSKRLCKQIYARSKADNIVDYKKEILSTYPELPTAVVELPRFGLTLQPWVNWGSRGSSPFWWKAYNSVKHHRHSHFSEANLKNVLNTVGGLFVLLLYFYRRESEVGGLSPDPILFRAGAPFTTDKLFGGNRTTVYRLKDNNT